MKVSDIKNIEDLRKYCERYYLKDDCDGCKIFKLGYNIDSTEELISEIIKINRQDKLKRLLK